MKKIFNLVILTALVALWSACSSESSSRNESAPLSVEVYQPVQSAPKGISVSGVLAAKQSAVLSTRMMAFVDQILVKQGDKVRAGQLLIRLNGSDLKAKRAQVQAQLTEAEAAAKNAQRDYDRFVKLHAQESVSDKELENMELFKTSMLSKLEMARQGLKEVDAMLAYTDIKAPFAGVVAQKLIEKGNMANPGMPLLVIEQPGEMEVKASVPENYIHQVEVGDAVWIEVKSLGCSLQGRISELSSSAALTGGQYTLKADVDLQGRQDVLSGMFVGIQLMKEMADSKVDNQSEKAINKVVNHSVNNEGEAPRIWIDESSVVKREQLRGVYVVNDDERALLRWVRLGKTQGNQVEVLSGLNGSERIVRSVNGKLYNGRRVSVAK